MNKEEEEENKEEEEEIEEAGKGIKLSLVTSNKATFKSINKAFKAEELFLILGKLFSLFVCLFGAEGQRTQGPPSPHGRTRERPLCLRT
jgi:glucosamine 6-phosphate synthetase-like amidotransferase/phosphosugar isomerase protein